jgi:hypothetical protein
VSKKGDVIVPSITGPARMKETRTALDGVAAELRRIIGEPLQHVGSREARLLNSVIAS